jgi:hypothetical protein
MLAGAGSGQVEEVGLDKEHVLAVADEDGHQRWQVFLLFEEDGGNDDRAD